MELTHHGNSDRLSTVLQCCVCVWGGVVECNLFNLQNGIQGIVLDISFSFGFEYFYASKARQVTGRDCLLNYLTSFLYI